MGEVYALNAGTVVPLEVDNLIPIEEKYCDYLDTNKNNFDHQILFESLLSSKNKKIDDYDIEFQLDIFSWLATEYILGVSKGGNYFIINYIPESNLFDFEASLEITPSNYESISSSVKLIKRMVDASFDWSDNKIDMEINNATDAGTDLIYASLQGKCGYTYLHHNLGPNTQALINNYLHYSQYGGF